MPDEVRVIRDIMSRLQHKLGWEEVKLPCTYLVLDLETTGFNYEKDRVVSLGMCYVEDCKLNNLLFDAPYIEFIFKWPEEVFVGKEEAIAVHGIDYAKSQAEGRDPKEILGDVDAAITWAMANNVQLVGHNIFKFDAPFLDAEFARAGIQSSLKTTDVIDTNVFVKAMQLGTLPGDDETLLQYYARVANRRAKGVFSNLDRYCMSHFNLNELGASTEDAHNSGYDCWLTHLVITRLNQMICGDEHV